MRKIARMPPDPWIRTSESASSKAGAIVAFVAARPTTDLTPHAQSAHRGRGIPPPDRRRRNAPQSPSPQTPRQRRDAT